ncbi:hypothetical protein QBC43DRAFT_118152 [Cladorrhinum sp. PSN259]|nr:hypothetical protein QBC43DRAFT_118152 [Cladorrhinum sp. PSN259]
MSTSEEDVIKMEEMSPENRNDSESTPPGSKITRLPPELISQVFQHLRDNPKSISPKELNDLCNLRRACKYFATIGTEYTIRTVLQKLNGDWTRLAIFFTRRDLERLRNLSREPGLKHMADKIRSIFFVSWAANPDMAADIDKYYESTLRYESGPWMPSKNKHPPIDLSPCAREAWCQRFRDLVDEQEALKPQISALLQEVLPSLPGLMSFYYRSGGLGGHPASRSLHTSLSPLCPQTAYDRQKGWNKIQRPGHDVELLYLFLRAFIKQETTLRTMTLSYLDWSFFHVKNKHGLPKILENYLFWDLYHFELWINNSFSAIDRSTGCKWKEESGKDGNSPGCAHEIVSSGLVAEFLESMPGLRSLSIHFPGSDYTKKHLNLPAPKIDWVIPLDQDWRHLNDLTIGGVLCTADDLESLLVTHRRTLRRLKLLHLRLVGSSVRSLLMTLRRELPRVTKFVIAGLWIGNLDEYGLPVATAAADKWSFTDSMEAKVSKWFVSPRLYWRGEEDYCPLDDWENGR